MADDDGGGLELNLVSQPAAGSQLPAARKKKRGSGKAWDKKKRKQQSMTTSGGQAQPGLGNQQPQQKQHQQQGAGAEGGGQSRAKPSAAISKSDNRKGSSQTTAAASPAKGAAKSGPSADGSTTAGPAATNSPATQNGDHRPSASKAQAGGNAAASPKHTSNHSTGPKVQKAAKPADREGHLNNSNGDSRADSNKEPSNERRRVLAMAGRTLTPRTPVSVPPAGGGEAHSSKSGGGGGVSSSARATKRKRSSAGAAGAPSGPVASGGVIDFTVGDTSTPNKKKKKKKKDDPATENKNRKAAATAAAVAKATAAMAKSGGKWWDDDDDDHVVAAKAKRAISTSYYAASGGFGGWKPGAAAADGAGEGHGGAEVEEDKDGGLPSDIHPNSVRTKAVDMDGEASKAMGILEALLGKGDGGNGGGPREESRRIKNGGKSKKKAKEEPPLDAAGDVPAARAADTSAAVDASEGVADEQLAMDVDGPEAEGEEPAAAGTPPMESSVSAEGRDDKTSSTTDAPGERSGDGAGSSSNGAVAFASRKNRARVANAAAAADAAGSSTVPLPEHHARPRELSRRAAVRPLASARSAHVMAAGPGATFAALNLPPKMVSHLEEPKGDLGGGGMGLVGPTVCQLAAMPVLAAGNNTVIKSETGSGKTLAYLLPMLCDLAAMEPRVEREMGTLAIVLAPTRELGSQILEVRAAGAKGLVPAYVDRCTSLPEGCLRLFSCLYHLRFSTFARLCSGSLP